MTSPAAALHPRNTLTYAGLLLGLAATAAAMAGRPASAGACIALAVIADTFDGRFARLFGHDDRRAALGAELDSLCDGCTFGMAPVICTALLAPAGSLTALTWLGGALYLIAAVTRLAFYNVTQAGRRGFIGLPAPVAALVWSSTLWFSGRSEVLACGLAVAGVAMVAPLPIPRPSGAGLVAFAVWPISVLVLHLTVR